MDPDSTDENASLDGRETSISGLYQHMESEGYQYVTLSDKHIRTRSYNLVNETKLGKKLLKESPLGDTQSPVLTLEASRVAAQHCQSQKIPPSLQ